MAWFEHGTSRIYYEVQGSGTPVLLMPGFAGNIEEFAALRESLVSEGYRVIAADLPGSGRSEPQPRGYTATFYEEDARSFAALLGALAVGPAHLMGFSDGGEVSLLLAALTPKLVRSVVTWGAVGVISDPNGQLLPVLYDMVDQPIPPMQGFRDYLVSYYGEANARSMTQNFVGAAREIIRRGGDISLSKAGNISCPVLLIAGEQDFFATPALVSHFAKRVATVQVLIAEGAGHDVYSDRTEWLTEKIVAWLKGH